MENNVFHDGDFGPLMERLKHIRDTSKDFVVQTEKMTARPTLDPQTFGQSGYGLHFEDMEGNTHHYPLTNWAKRQTAEKCGIPVRYYEKMEEAKLFPLLCSNINGWKDKRFDKMGRIKPVGKRLLRTTEGKVRAYLSDRFKAIDNYDIGLMTGKMAQEKGLTFNRADISETKLYMRVLDMSKPYDLAEPGEKPDIVYAGAVLSNSEVGNGATRFEPLAWRQACANGAIIGERALKRIHVGERLEEGVFTPETIAKESQTIYLKMRDLLHATFNPEVFDSWLDNLRATRHAVLENPVEVIKSVGIHFGFSEKDTDAIISSWGTDQTVEPHLKTTQYGVIQAVTMTAKKMGADKMVEFERAGGELAGMKLEDLPKVKA